MTPAAAGACGGATLEDTLGEGNGDGGANGSTPTPPTKPKHPYFNDAGPVGRDASVRDASIPDAMVDAKIPDASKPDVECTDLPQPPIDAGNQCDWYVPLPCGILPDASAIPQEVCKYWCGTDLVYGCYASTFDPGGGGDDGDPLLHCVTCAIGRRPEGFATTRNAANDASPSVGRFFAVAAELEAASVFSFVRLERELAAHGAPADLRRRARRAARDERRHARVTRALAERHGAAAVLPAEGPSDVRALDAVALENAMEGCVRETYGALVATVQAERASDSRVKAAMRQIAGDETDHAALAWSVASWVEERLDDEARERVRAAFAKAIDELAREVCVEPPAELRRVAGLPSAREARAMVEGLREMLWAA